MTPPLLLRVHEALAAADIPHALIGAAALAVHGVSRSTFDQDLLVTDTGVLDLRIWDSLAATAGIDIRRGDYHDPLAGVVRVTADSERDVDVIVGRDDWQREIVQEALTHDLRAGAIPVASPAGLVLLKLYAGGPQDFWDIDQLRAIGGSALDAAVNSRVVRLPAPMREVWTRLAFAP
ncbi:MAG: hypothetical protein H0W08_12245 [Acidobacteria bacterium]|nr:hypothetical protein [Acidobacteriota bacterium]